jgi:hypothetical protein
MLLIKPVSKVARVAVDASRNRVEEGFEYKVIVAARVVAILANTIIKTRKNTATITFRPFFITLYLL